MTIDQWIASLSACIAFFGFLVVIVQVRDGNRQRRLESQIRLYDINRELITLGFSNPALFAILNGTDEGRNPVVERRYLQLWLNLLSLIFSFQKAGGFEKEYQESCEHDIRDMITMKNMRRHWEAYGKYYPASFRNWVTDTLNNAGKEEAAAKRRRAKK